MAAAGEQALAARPLVAVLDLRRRLAYWSNITEEHAGWVFKVRLSDAYRGGGWPPEPLSARERRTLAVGPILSHASALHARYTERSDLGTTRPGPADSRSTRWLEAEHELLLVEYEVLGARACQHSLCPALDRPSGPSTCSGHPPPLPGLERGALPFAPFGRHKEAAAGLYSCPKSPIPQHVFTIQVTGRTTSSPTRATTPARAERNRAMLTELCCVNTYHMLGHLRTFVVAPPSGVTSVFYKPPHRLLHLGQQLWLLPEVVGQRAGCALRPAEKARLHSDIRLSSAVVRSARGWR